MSDHKHTPGIWEATRGGELMPEDERIIQSTLGFNASGIRQIRTIARTFGNAGPEQSLANARLIAAAPQMKDVLREMILTMDAQVRVGIRWDPQTVADARAAYAAATGDA